MKKYKQFMVVFAALSFTMVSAQADAEFQPETIDLGRLTVVESAVLENRTDDDMADPVEVLEGPALERRRAGNIGEMLGQELGIANASFGPGVGRPIIRGQGGSRVQVLENGIRTMDLSTITADHAVAVDPLNARKVEVIKGPSTLIYGSGASGGVVNVLNNRMPRTFEQGFSGNLALSLSDNASGKLGSADITLGMGDFALQADVGMARNDDLDIPGFQEVGNVGRRGVLENSSLDNRSAGVSSVYSGDRGYLGIAVSTLDNDYGLPEVIDPLDPEFERIDMTQMRYDLRGELRDPWQGVTRARVAFGYNDYRHDEVEFEGSDREVHASFFNNEWDLRTDLTHTNIGPFTGVVGTQFTRRDFAAELEGGAEFFVPPTVTRSSALFLVEEMELEGIGRLELGGRFENNSSVPRGGAEVDFNLLSLSAKLTWEMDEQHHLKVSVNRSQRAPTAEELFSFGRHAATRTFEVGAPTLGIETVNGIDVALDRHGGRWEWQVNFFVSRIDDFIYGEFLVDAFGDIILVDDDGQLVGDLRNRLQYYLQRDARFVGVEAEMGWRLVENGPMLLDLRVFGDQVRGTLRGPGGGDLPRITPQRFGAALDWARGGFDGNIELVRTHAQRHIGQGETPTPGYHTLGLDIGYTIQRAAAETRFYLRGRNLLDEEIRLHTSFLKDDVPLAGRSVMAGVRVQF